MRVCEEFSRYASHYGSVNVIQSKVAQKLVDDTRDCPRRILDLGCGSGTLYTKIGWEFERFIGVDFSSAMLSLHPCGEGCELIEGDFNEEALFKRLGSEPYDRIYSASALQWAVDLPKVFKAIASLNAPVSLAIFTSGTFRALHEAAGVPPLLRPVSDVCDLAEEFFGVDCEMMRYTLSFDSVREMLRYIKRSGVSGGRRVLDYAATKKLIDTYPLDHLEFEVVFIQT